MPRKQDTRLTWADVRASWVEVTIVILTLAAVLIGAFGTFVVPFIKG